MKKSLFNGIVAVFAFALLFAFGPNVTQASAACRTQQPAQAGEGYDENGQYIGFTFQQTVPGWSTCHDINVRDLSFENGNPVPYLYFRVRFYPSSGGSYPNNWTPVEGTIHYDVPIATNVLDGTKYRVEWYPQAWSWIPHIHTSYLYTLKD